MISNRMPTDPVTAAEITARLCRAFTEYPPDETVLGRAIRYWSSQEVLRPIGGPHTGRGRERLFKSEEILRAAILFQLAKFDVAIGTMKLMMKEIDAEIDAVTPGGDMIDLLDRAAENRYFVWTTWGYPAAYQLAFTVRNPAPPAKLYPRMSVYARVWRERLGL